MLSEDPPPSPFQNQHRSLWKAHCSRPLVHALVLNMVILQYHNITMILQYHSAFCSPFFHPAHVSSPTFHLTRFCFPAFHLTRFCFPGSPVFHLTRFCFPTFRAPKATFSKKTALKVIFQPNTALKGTFQPRGWPGRNNFLCGFWRARASKSNLF